MLAAAWGGTCLGRLISIWRDKTGTRFNTLSAGIEALAALLIAAPWLGWTLL